MSNNKAPLKLSPLEANAIMVMLDSDMERTFDEGVDPIADWEVIHFHAYQLLAYQKFKQWYVENHND